MAASRRVCPALGGRPRISTARNSFPSSSVYYLYLSSREIGSMELQIEGLSKTYANGVKALDNVSLTIPQGMYGLLGPNGAGKSTLMRIVATLQEPDSGSAFLGNIDVLKQKDEV